MKFVLAELYKLKKLKKTYLAIIGMNLIPLIVLLVVLYLIFFNPNVIRGSIGAGKMYETIARKSITSTYFVEVFSISFSGLLFMSLIIGELISNEFSSGTIKLLLTQPVKRSSLFFYKFLTVFIFYFITIAIGYLIIFITGYSVFLFENKFYEFISIAPMIKLSFTFILIDISYLAYVCLVATISPSVEITISLSIMIYILMKIIDGILIFGNKINAFGKLMAKISPYTYTTSTTSIDYNKLKPYLMGNSNSFPVNTELLSLNFCYTVIFFLLAMWIFIRRQN